ncbi:PD-(D/E)XK motif protein [Vandammella animalimorsus]|uniref:PD-(D/E)XK motif protein n=1 Tax=Vandammella animalimorsus TaxID=2029117 RepID=A0A3M6RTI5_9BURK|nr:PD-(D/E)XK motif protein [Vandammella animalimorsus]RMX18081.1 PD-(D/E)XK motif protein [Vandammella animalimorsus]
MVDGLSPTHWSQLRAVRPQSEDALAVIPITIDGNETGLSSAMDQAGLLHLLIPVTKGPDGALPADLNGLKVRHRRLETGDILDLSAPPSHEQVFTPFCNEIVDAVVRQSREPWRAVAAIIRAWQSAWKPARQSMDKTVQIGLFGELLVLRSLMIPVLGPVAVDQWSGPERERHDFVGPKLHIEVKTTRKSRPEHEISRLDQLCAPAGCKLLFVSVQLEESIGGDESLASQVDAIINLLRGDAVALDLFLTKMANMGWSEEVRNSGELLRFFLRRADVYAVDDDFPRLPDGFSPPSGVVSVKYTIDLANLPSLGMDEVGVIIRAANNGCGL